MDHKRKAVQDILLQFSHKAFILLLTILSPSFFAQGKQMMFTVKNFYDEVEASYEFTYTEN